MNTKHCVAPPLVGTQMNGLIMNRYVVKTQGLCELSIDQIAKIVSPLWIAT